MIPNSLVNEINKKIPSLISSFGGTETFISYIKEANKIPLQTKQRDLSNNDYQKLIGILYLFLKFNKNINIISPWALPVDLREETDFGVPTPQSIDIEEPYRIYNLEGVLLYSVTDHQGIFGQSFLDKILLNNSYTGSTFFLKYKTYEGLEIIKLLVVNLYTREIIIPNELFKPVEDLKTSTISIANYTNSVAQLYIQESLPILGYNNQNIQTNVTPIILDPNVSHDIVVTNSMYIYINTTGFIDRTLITNPSNDLLINLFSLANPADTENTFFVAFKVDPSLVNKIFNKTLGTTSKRINEIIELKDNI